MATTTTDRRPLIAYLRVQRATDRQVIAILNRSAERIRREMALLESRVGVGAAVRRDQLALTEAAIQRELSGLWARIGLTVQAARAEAAAIAIEQAYNPSRLRAVMPTAEIDQLMRAAREQAAAGVNTVQARLNLSKRTLAESVYGSENLVNKRVEDVVNSALSRGASAHELAQEVRHLVRPDVRGGIRYAALRLARTELNNAFHAQQVMSGIEVPWTTGMRWNLSGSHPRPDECNAYADSVHFEGGDPGVYKPSEVPGKPHPNCLCFMTAEQNSRAEFVRSFRNGDYDRFVDQVIRDGGITIR